MHLLFIDDVRDVPILVNRLKNRQQILGNIISTFGQSGRASCQPLKNHSHYLHLFSIQRKGEEYLKLIICADRTKLRALFKTRRK